MAPTGYLYNREPGSDARKMQLALWATPPCARERAISSFFRKRAAIRGRREFSRPRGIPSSTRVTHHSHVTWETRSPIDLLQQPILYFLIERWISCRGDTFRSIFLTHLIGGNYSELSNPRVHGKRRKRLLRWDFSRSRADKWHPETLGRRGRRSVTGETRDHPLLLCPRASRSPLLFLFHPQHTLSLGYPSPQPSACVRPSLSLLRSISDFTNIHISSFLSYRIFCLYLSHPSHHVLSLLFHPLRSPCLFLPFILFLSHSFFLLDLLSTPISFSLLHPRFSLLALPRASLSIPQQPSRHWPS